MNRIYSRLGWFLTGVIAGVLGTFLWEVYRKPTLPTDELYDISDNLAKTMDSREGISNEVDAGFYNAMARNRLLFQPVEPFDPDYQMGEMIMGRNDELPVAPTVAICNESEE